MDSQVVTGAAAALKELGWVIEGMWPCLACLGDDIDQARLWDSSGQVVGLGKLDATWLVPLCLIGRLRHRSVWLSLRTVSST
jgi:hypothetical protein